MPVTRIRRGLDIPLAGGLETTDIEQAAAPRAVALLPQDVLGIKPRVLVREGDSVRRGTPLFTDRRQDTVLYTSPVAGTVQAVHRGDRRRLLSVVIAAAQRDAAESFGKLDPSAAQRAQLVETLCRSGLWTGFRQRPFDRVANPADKPRAIFITVTDTAPLAPPPETVLAPQEDEFRVGVAAVRKLIDGPIYLCCTPGATGPCFEGLDGVERHDFSGPHPSGNVGTHIHTLSPVGPGRLVWHIGYQDVASIGRLCLTGERDAQRIVAVVGPGVKRPTLVQTVAGAALGDLLHGQLAANPARVISGSVLAGVTAEPGTPTGYLGRYVNQVTVVADEAPRRFLGWLLPGLDQFSVTNTYIGKFVRRRFAFDTNTHGSHRAIVPIGAYERVMPLDIQPTYLIKALASDDIESAEKLGALELTEEDLALCEFVCPSKTAVTSLLRKMLTRIEKEG